MVPSLSCNILAGYSQHSLKQYLLSFIFQHMLCWCTSVSLTVSGATHLCLAGTRQSGCVAINTSWRMMVGTHTHTHTVVMHVCTSVEEVAPPQLTIGPHPLQVVPIFKLFGVTLDNHLSWKQHSMVKTASHKLYMLRRFRSLGTLSDELKAVYTSSILPELVYASPTWSSSLNVTQSKQLERVQLRACKVILGPAYIDYDNAVVTLNLPRLTTTYKHALTKFGAGLLQIPCHQHLLPPEAPHQRTTRHQNLLVPIKTSLNDIV